MSLAAAGELLRTGQIADRDPTAGFCGFALRQNDLRFTQLADNLFRAMLLARHIAARADDQAQPDPGTAMATSRRRGADTKMTVASTDISVKTSGNARQ